MGTRHQVLLSRAAGVKICLEAGERGRILSARGRDAMGCQVCSSLLCLLTVTGGGRGWAPCHPVRSRLGLFAALRLMKNAAAHRLVHGIGFSSEFAGLVPGEAGSILRQLWVEMGPPRLILALLHLLSSHPPHCPDLPGPPEGMQVTKILPCPFSSPVLGRDVWRRDHK